MDVSLVLSAVQITNQFCKLVDDSCKKVVHKLSSNHHGRMEVTVLPRSLLERKDCYSYWNMTQLCKSGNARFYVEGCNAFNSL